MKIRVNGVVCIVEQWNNKQKYNNRKVVQTVFNKFLDADVGMVPRKQTVTFVIPFLSLQATKKQTRKYVVHLDCRWLINSFAQLQRRGCRLDHGALKIDA